MRFPRAKSWPGVILILAGLASISFVFVSYYLRRGPRLVLPPLDLVLGEGRPGETMRGSFDIVNSGVAPLEFKLMPGCGCSTLTPRSGTIPPDGRESIEVAVTLGTVYGDDRNVRIQVNTNDPLQPAATFTVVANCPAPLDVNPRVVDFGLANAGTEKTLQVRVRAREGASLRSDSAFTASSTSRHVEVAQDLGTDGTAVLEVKLLPTAPQGQLTASVDLWLSDEERVPIPVSGRVVSEIVTAPAVLRRLDVERKTTLLVFRPDGQPLAAASSANVPPGIRVSDVTPADSPRRIYQVSLEEPSTDDSTSGVLEFHFTNTSTPVVIPINPSPSRDAM